MPPDTMQFEIHNNRELPGGLVVRIPDFDCHGQGSIPGQGTEILQVVRPKEKKRNTQQHLEVFLQRMFNLNLIKLLD